MALDKGDELTISYLQDADLRALHLLFTFASKDEDLLKSTAVRQQKLQNWLVAETSSHLSLCSLHVQPLRKFTCMCNNLSCDLCLVFAQAACSEGPRCSLKVDVALTRLQPPVELGNDRLHYACLTVWTRHTLSAVQSWDFVSPGRRGLEICRNDSVGHRAWWRGPAWPHPP